MHTLFGITLVLYFYNTSLNFLHNSVNSMSTKFSFSAKNCLIFISAKFSFILFVLTVHHLYNNSADVP